LRVPVSNQGGGRDGLKSIETLVTSQTTGPIGFDVVNRG
jgi:hypothetical protein